MVHFVPNNENENWSGEDSVARPRVVRRGIADIEDEIDDGGWLFVAFLCISINWGLTVETWEAICGFFNFALWINGISTEKLRKEITIVLNCSYIEPLRLHNLQIIITPLSKQSKDFKSFPKNLHVVNAQQKQQQQQQQQQNKKKTGSRRAKEVGRNESER